jgi:hypothetical protein
MPTNKKAIILLYPSKNYDITELKESLFNCCENHDIEIISTITARSKYDYKAVQLLIEEVSKQTGPIALIIDRYICTTSYFSIWSVIGTLLGIKAIDNILIHSIDSNSEDKLQTVDYKQDISGILQKSEIDFLLLSQNCFEYIEQKIRELASYIRC